MFDTGSKIILLESSVRKTTGPRKGSLGYVESRDGLFVLLKEKLFLLPINIAFFRYGNDQHFRNERKKVWLVTPIPEYKQPVRGSLTELLNNLSPKNSASFFPDLYKRMGASKLQTALPIVAAAPYMASGESIMEQSKEEKTAWLTCAMSGSLIPTISDTLNRRIYEKYQIQMLKDRAWWDSLLRQMADPQVKGKTIRDIVTSEEYFKIYVLLLKTIEAVYMGHVITRLRKNMNRYTYVRNGEVDIRILAGMIGGTFTSRLSLLLLKELAAKSGTKEMRMLFLNSKIIREEYATESIKNSAFSKRIEE